MKRLLYIPLLVLLACHPAKAVIGFTACQQSSSSTTSVQTTNLTTSAGSMLVAFTQEGLDNTKTVVMSDTSGTGTWTQTVSGYSSNGTTNRAAMFVKPNSAAVTSVTATWSVTAATVTDLIVCEFTGGVTASAEDSSVNNNQTSSAGVPPPGTSGALTTTNANDVLVCAMRVSGAYTAPTAGTGYTIPTNGSSARAILEYKIVSATQSAVTTTIGWTNALNDASVYAGFKAAAGATTVPERNLLGVGL